MFKTMVLGFFCISLALPLEAAETINAPNLVGRWSDVESNSTDEFTFYKNGSFAFTYQKNKLPVVERLDGAYRLAQNICGNKEDNGNLWIVMGSTRCCYTAYFLADKLVLDGVGNTRGMLLGVCKERTFKRRTQVD